MTRSTALFAILLLFALGAPAASAAPFPPEDSLTPTQNIGRDLLARLCVDVAAADNKESACSNDGGESYES